MKLLLSFFILLGLRAAAQNVGIGTTNPNPNALLHLELNTSTSNGFLVTGQYNGLSTVPNLGTGSRLMFFPGKAAFRAGYAMFDTWDNSNVGIYSMGLGLNARASGPYAVAIGNGAIANSNNAVSLGYGCISSGFAATSLGTNTTANGYYSIATGENTVASGMNSSASGYFTKASGDYSTTLGLYTIAKGYAMTALGMYNDSILLSDQSTPGAYVLLVGNGDDQFSRSNAMVVRKDGRVGIGTSTPGFLLDVSGRARIQSEGGSNSAGIWFNKGDNSGLAAFIGMYNDSYVGLYGGVGGWDFVMNTSTGNVGIGTLAPAQKLSVAGNICYTGTIGACSDIRYKKNILPITHALASLITLHGIYYNWNKEKFPDKGFTVERQIGFSAQEIEKLFPEVVQTDADGYKSVDYSRLTPVLVEAIKEQQKQIDLLIKKVSQLEKASRKK